MVAGAHPRLHRGAKLACIALAGLLSGIAACSASQPNEVVVQPVPPENTAGTDATATIATDGDGDGETAPIPPDQATAKRTKPRRTPTSRELATHCCAGKNECKGLGGCKSGSSSCKGKNHCKGMGGCRSDHCDPSASITVTGTIQKPTPIVIQQGGASCKGMNDCKGNGGCKGC